MSVSGEEYAPPKYAQIVTAIRNKIADGTYPPGSQLPSETQLIREFAVSRPTVVRALQVLQLRGFIDREHGKGSYVKAAPPVAEDDFSRPARAVLDRAEAVQGGSVVEAGACPAPAHVAAALALPEGTPVVMRRVLLSDGTDPCELITFWCPIELAEGTDLGKAVPLSAGIRQHMQAVKGLRLDHVTERLAARHPSREERELLGLETTAAVLGVVARVFAANRLVMLIEVALPGVLHELEDTYAL
ncbi:DNA-binding GntR family transcriptional regulator [Streptosporangium becharense]|uniref:DNA-binding GntR family transcriptional regulator n=1 Tax=Streptosporangium becharense TaxID=1816182 RepID=A0A7W9IGA3_9ACTN|nr:GntR family transcriptional regulator [Streptosporangium becharense]MBB2908763.1 DNA-binding GntR family transcriptional regulator [Streptosporangium becharense]MBB5820219.1 DNA-binding GntR family transcriptional regulator [Streptosporangium becharense]